jgi:hypothetical protein
MLAMNEAEKQYEAVIYTINGMDKVASFEDSDRAHA